MADINTETNHDLKKRKKTSEGIVRTIKWLLILLMVIAMLTAAFCIFLITSNGRQFLTKQIYNYTNHQVQIYGLSNPFSRHIKVEGIQLKNPNGDIWLNAKGLKVDWAPWTLFKEDKVVLQQFDAQEISLESAPTKRALVTLSTRGNEWISLAKVVDIQALSIDQLRISDKILPINVKVKIIGKSMIRDLSQFIITNNLIKILNTKPDYHILQSKRLPDFKFTGKVSGQLINEKYGKVEVPIEFSVDLPEKPKQAQNNDVAIYLDLDSKN